MSVKKKNHNQLNKLSIYVCICCCMFLTLPVFSAWYSNWAFREMITFNNAPVNDLTNFPVLLYISNHQYLKYLTATNGADILFTTADGSTKLDHEIENFNQANGQIWIWIRLPVHDSADADSNKVYMYYDISQTGNQENAANVWTNGYIAVWHFNETSGNINDVTGNSILGTNTGSIQMGEKGASGLCARFDGSDDYYHCGNSSVFDITGDITIEAWIKTNITHSFTAGFRTIVQKDKHTSQPYGMIYDNNNKDGIFLYNNGSSSNRISADAGFTAANDWMYLATTASSGNGSFYINGSLSNTKTGITIPNDSGSAVRIGWDGDSGSDRFFEGWIDEIRISSTARSAEYFAAAYTNLTLPENYRTFGSLECGSRGIKIGGAISGEISNNIPVLVSGTVNCSTNTAASGDWEVIVPAGSFTIRASSNGYIFTPQSYSVTPSATNLNYNFTASKGYALSGYVFNVNGEGLRDINVYLSGTMIKNTNTDINGFYSFTISSGAYQISFSASGYNTSQMSLTGIIITSSDSTTNNIYLTNLYTISGAIYPWPSSLNSVTIKLIGAVSAGSAKTDSTGRFSFTSPAGYYSLYPELEGYAFIPDKYSININTDNTNCNFSLVNQKYLVSGYIKDIYSRSLKSIRVVIDNNTLKAAETDNAGRYVFYASSGLHNITIDTAEGINFSPFTQNIRITNNDFSNVNFTAGYGNLETGSEYFSLMNSRLLSLQNGYHIYFYKKSEGFEKCRIALLDLKGIYIEKIYEGLMARGFYTYKINTDRTRQGIYILRTEILISNKWKQYSRLVTLIK